MFYRTVKALSVAALAIAVGFGSADAASASTGTVSAIASIAHNETVAAAKANPQLQEAATALRAGKAVEVRVNGGRTETLQVRSGVLEVTAGRAAAVGAGRVQPADLCAAAVTGAIIGLGAAALAAIVAVALLTPGVDVITIVGVTLTVGQWSAIAAVAGSVSAVYNLVSLWVC